MIETRRGPAETSTAIRDSAITAVRERMRGRGAASQDWSKVPTVRPAVLGMFVSDEGELWVRTPVEEGEVFDVYDREGQLQRTVSNPLPIIAGYTPPCGVTSCGRS